LAHLTSGVASTLIAVLALSRISGFGAPSEATGSPQDGFKLGCSTLPFEVIKKPRPIDDSCGIHGDTNRTADAPQAAQNAAKNNFCASGPAILVTNFTFRHLQDDTEANKKIECCGFGKPLPSDRGL
jgi:hypothetical protein